MSYYIRPENFIDDYIYVIDGLTAGFVEKGFKKIVSAGISSGLIATVITLFIVYFFYKVYHEKAPFEESIIAFSKLTFVFLLACSWGIFHKTLYVVLTDYPIYVSRLLTEVISTNTGGGGSSLNKIYVNGMEQVMVLLHSMGISIANVFLCILGAILILISTICFTVIALILLTIAKLTLAIYLVIAPYFIGMYLFDGTRGLSESWLKHTIGSALVPLFLGVGLALISVTADLSIVGVSGSAHALKSFGVNTAAGDGPSFSGILAYVCCSLCAVGIVWASKEMASSVTSSLTQSALGGGRSARGAARWLKEKNNEQREVKQSKEPNSQNKNQDKSALKAAVQKRQEERAKSAAIKQATANRRRRLA